MCMHQQVQSLASRAFFETLRESDMPNTSVGADEPRRDFIGYGRVRPDPQWPNGARLAVNFVINYEEGSESAIDNGDEVSEEKLLEFIYMTPFPRGERMLGAESMYEYGSRVGIWRLLRLLTERRLTATVWACGLAVEKYPEPVRAMADAGFEIACHHYRWVSYQNAGEEAEREHLRKAIRAIAQAAGKRPVGFLHWSGRNTRRLVVEEGGFLYDSDAYNDELPYWVDVGGKQHLVIPYMLDNNDARYGYLPGWRTGDDFLAYNKATFDQLYEEGASTPGMMTVAFHTRLSGHPGRARAVAQFLDYVVAHEHVWICTREQIAQHWRRVHPARE
jgi:peptidoglycan/xylan/chitin deacetylase (PgdA/CDA1 family)